MVAVQPVDSTVYEPDALVRCGPWTPDDAVEVPDALVIVEVVSRSSRSTGSGAKLDDYFTLPSVRRYLVVNADTGTITHHCRSKAGDISTRILGDDELILDPPGLTIGVAGLFGSQSA